MRHRQRKIIYLAIAVMLLSGATGSVAKAAGPESAPYFPETADSEVPPDAPEQTVRQKVSGKPEEKHVVNGGRETGEDGQSQSSETVLAVTDLRINNPVVREYADKELFLSEWGFEDREPYYEYFTEDGTLQLELYYDASVGLGCGLRYGSGEDTEPKGFLFNGSRNYTYCRDFMNSGGTDTDPYSVLPFDGGDGKDGVEDYEESVIYREDGRPAGFTSRGWVTYLTEKRETIRILQIDWTYREDGTLQKRDYWHNGMIFGTWYSTRQSYYDEQERLVYEHCYVTHGSVDYYYIYEGESEVPTYCLIMDHNLNLLCAELLEYHGTGAEDHGDQTGDSGAGTESHGAQTGGSGAGTESHGAQTGGSGARTERYYGRIGPTLAGETETPYAAAVLEAAEKAGRDCSGYVTHTYAADYDGDGREEAFVICGREVKAEYEYGMIGDCWFVNSDLEPSMCIDRAYAFDLSQEFICQEGGTYLLIRYSIGFPWCAEMYTVQDNVPVEISGSYADKYID
ncbi:MAG: hypothetical protein K2P59_01590, partial [Acetatifactor sp.]|nr:hypothetical protein [Acetatifactor sp.]